MAPDFAHRSPTQTILILQQLSDVQDLQILNSCYISFSGLLFAGAQLGFSPVIKIIVSEVTNWPIDHFIPHLIDANDTNSETEPRLAEDIYVDQY